MPKVELLDTRYFLLNAEIHYLCFVHRSSKCVNTIVYNIFLTRIGFQRTCDVTRQIRACCLKMQFSVGTLKMFIFGSESGWHPVKLKTETQIFSFKSHYREMRKHWFLNNRQKFKRLTNPLGIFKLVGLFLYLILNRSLCCHNGTVTQQSPTLVLALILDCCHDVSQLTTRVYPLKTSP